MTIRGALARSSPERKSRPATGCTPKVAKKDVVPSIASHAFKDLLLRPPVEKIRVGRLELGEHFRRAGVINLRESRRIVVRQRLDQRCIHNGEDGDVRSDSEHQCYQRNRGETRRLDEHAQFVANVLQSRVHGTPMRTAEKDVPDEYSKARRRFPGWIVRRGQPADVLRFPPPPCSPVSLNLPRLI